MNEPNFLLYEAAPGQPRLLVRVEDESVWLSQAQMVELFQTSKQNISLHIRNVFEECELREESVVKEYLTTAADGKSYRVLHYAKSNAPFEVTQRNGHMQQKVKP